MDDLRRRLLYSSLGLRRDLANPGHPSAIEARTQSTAPTLVLKNVKIVDCSGDGFHMVNGKILMEDCEASGNGGDGLHVKGAVNLTMRRVKANNNDGHGIFVSTVEARQLAHEMRRAAAAGASPEDLQVTFGARLKALGGGFANALKVGGNAADIVNAVSKLADLLPS